MRLMRRVLVCTNLCSRHIERRSGGWRHKPGPTTVHIRRRFASYRLIKACDRYLAQRVVALKEPPQKVFDIPMPSPNGSFREPLFHPQVVSVRFEQRTIGRRHLARDLQVPQETKPADRTGEELFVAAPTIFVLKVPGPTIDPAVHACLDRSRKGVRGRRQAEQILDQQQVCLQPPPRTTLLPFATLIRLPG